MVSTCFSPFNPCTKIWTLLQETQMSEHVHKTEDEEEEGLNMACNGEIQEVAVGMRTVKIIENAIVLLLPV